MAKKLVVEGWTLEPLRRGPDRGVIDSGGHRYNQFDTRVCPVCCHRHCAAAKGSYAKVRGMCEDALPGCSSDEDVLCRKLGAPKLPAWDYRKRRPRGYFKAHDERKRAVELYAHRIFKRCREVTITVEEGHRG